MLLFDFCMDVSNNDLYGTIPTTGPFERFLLTKWGSFSYHHFYHDFGRVFYKNVCLWYTFVLVPKIESFCGFSGFMLCYYCTHFLCCYLRIPDGRNSLEMQFDYTLTENFILKLYIILYYRICTLRRWFFSTPFSLILIQINYSIFQSTYLWCLWMLVCTMCMLKYYHVNSIIQFLPY